jgi:hypothetical protein
MGQRTVEELEKGVQLNDLVVDGIIYGWILEKSVCRARTGLIWLKTAKTMGSCEHGNGPSVFIKCSEFLE